MRTFNFKARNIGEEKYLTYTMGEECELDEDVLDYCEDNDVKELLDIIYEEDEDYDYLTYDITGRLSLADYTQTEMNCEQVLNILRNVANGLVSLKEQAVHLAYILLNKNHIYIDENYELKFMCIPVENKGSVVAEFKGFVRQLLANMKYDVEEDLSYVGKLLTYINGSSFNLRGLAGLTEALMEEAGIGFEETASIDADGVEVVSSEEEVQEEEAEEKSNVSDFMSSLDESGEALPEIGDDEDEEEFDETETDEEELDSILPAGMKAPEGEEQQTEKEVEAEADTETAQASESDGEKGKENAVADEGSQETETVEIPEIPEIKPIQDEPPKMQTQETVTKKETDVDLIKNRIKELVGEVPTAKTKADTGSTIKTLAELDEFLDSKPPVVKKNVVKVNRAALIQSAAEHESATDELTAEENPFVNGEAKKNSEEKPASKEKSSDKAEKPKSNSILSKTVDEMPKTGSLLNAPKVNPYLVRVNTDERIMITKATFKIGKATRGVDYTISGNGAVSRQHAIIVQRDGVCYIKDNKSTNHTYVNGKAVEEGVEEILTHDSMIKLGDEEFQFKLK